MNNPVYQRWLAVSLLVLLVGSLTSLIFVPLLNDWLDLHDQKNNLLFRLQRQQSIAARSDSVAQNLDNLRQQLEQQRYLSQSASEALASAELQNIIKTTVNDAGGQLTSTQGLPADTENDYLKITVKVRMTGTIETLRTVLHNLESNLPILLIQQLSITPMRGGRNRNTNALEASSQLNVSFDVVIFIQSKLS